MSLHTYPPLTARSAEAIRLCNELLEPAADHFAMARFAVSGLGAICKEMSYTYEDGSEMYISFDAAKLEDTEDIEVDESSLLGFSLTISQKCRFEKSMYWPGLNGAELAPGDEVIMPVTNVPGNHDSKIIQIDLARCYVREVWDFYIDQEGFEPQKEIRWEFIDGENEDDALAIVYAHAPEISDDFVLDDQPDNDIVLRESDSTLRDTFSELDLGSIKGALRQLGYVNDYVMQSDIQES